MKIHIITVGRPKLDYAKSGWEEYLGRLKHYHSVKSTHINDKHNNPRTILEAANNSYKVSLIKEGRQFSSLQLADLLEKRALDTREISFIVGGPEGLPKEVIDQTDLKWSFSELTFPHDLAMIILLEALYRASTINAGLPYHK